MVHMVQEMSPHAPLANSPGVSANRVSLSQLIDTVQKNCTITDARHARDMTMCTFLLEMREYFRWEMEIPFHARVPKDELGEWLNARESIWDTVEEEDFAPLPLSDSGVDPFEFDLINQELIPQGLVYSSGLGRFRKPHFVLAQLHRQEQREGLNVLVAGCEYARDLIAPPATLRNGTIFLRMDSIRRLLWNKYEEWQWREKNSALGRAFTYYGFDSDIERGLDRMAEGEAEAMILHEVGEARAEKMLGEAWGAMLGQLTSKHGELLARAVRDHLADCLITLPTLLQRGAEGSVHFYIANLTGIRRALFPIVITAYEQWQQTSDTPMFLSVITHAEAHWRNLALELMRTFDSAGPNGDARLNHLAEHLESISL